LGYSKPGFVVFCGLVFSVLDPLYLGGGGGRNFLVSNPFLKTISASDAPRGFRKSPAKKRA